MFEHLKSYEQRRKFAIMESIFVVKGISGEVVDKSVVDESIEYGLPQETIEEIREKYASGMKYSDIRRYFKIGMSKLHLLLTDDKSIQQTLEAHHLPYTRDEQDRIKEYYFRLMEAMVRQRPPMSEQEIKKQINTDDSISESKP